MQTIGERLEDARKQKGISIRESAEATKIRGEYLQKFESNHFDLGLSEIYVRGFLRTYANFLKLPAERILNDYASLGHNDSSRPRQPSREIYGRMDVSVASAGERGDRSSAPAAEQSRAQPKQSRSRTNLPAAPLLDPALVLKIGKISAGVLVAILVIWGAKSIIGGIAGGSADTAKPAPLPTVATQPAAEPTITIIAIDAVRLKVATVADGRVLLDATLSRGQSQVVPWPGQLYITATAGENVKIESSTGKRFVTGFTGYNRAMIPAPGSP